MNANQLHFDDAALNEYLDFALPPARHAEVDAHLAACPECAARLAELRALFVALETLPDAPLERDLSRPVVAALRPQRAKTEPLAAPLFRLVFAAQAAAAVVLIGLSWPVLAANFQLAALSPLIAQVVRVAVSTANSTAGRWQAALDSAQRLIQAGPQWPQLPAFPAVGWGLCLAAVALLWLLGNGLLLRGGPASHRSGA
ncbi:MAG: anti-sigma factor family protein [Anaerolineales bacterium]